MKNNAKKILWKAVNIIVRSVTYTAIILLIFSNILLAFAYAQGYAMDIPIITNLICLGWLGIMGSLYLLEKK